MDYLILLVNSVCILFLVALNGFFVASEFSIVKIRPSRLETLIKEGNKRAVYAKQVTDHLDAYLSVTQLGITIASLGLGWIGEPTVASALYPLFEMLQWPKQLQHTLAFVIAFSVITSLHIVLGELVPKSLSIQKTEQIVLFVARPLILFDRMMYPAVWFMNHVANWTVRKLGVEVTTEAEDVHNEEEIRLLMEESHKHGFIDKTELTYLDNVFEFNDRKANDIMVPRIDMACFYVENSFDQNLKVAINEQFTRYPLCKGDKDHIIGYVHMKDILEPLSRGEKIEVRTIARKVLTAPESIPLARLLKKMQNDHSQLALLIDEYGGTSGMVTMEDIIEEIVGEIRDEFDEERPEVEDLGDKTYSVDGKVILEEINDTFELNLDTEDVDTLGGWLITRVEYPPRVGMQYKNKEAIFIVESTDRRRITRVKVQLLHEPENIHEEIREEYL